MRLRYSISVSGLSVEHLGTVLVMSHVSSASWKSSSAAVSSSQLPDVADAGCTLLEEQITLFGECVLSEDSTPSNCQQLEQALSELQEAIETCQVDKPEDCDTEEVASALKADPAPEGAVAKPAKSGAKRRAVKNLLHMLTLGLFKTKLSPYQVASFLAAPEEVDPDLKGESRAVLVAQLKEDGVPDDTIQNAVINILPFLPGQDSKWGESLERPKK